MIVNITRQLAQRQVSDSQGKTTFDVALKVCEIMTRAVSLFLET